MTDWNTATIKEFRSNGGKVGGHFEGATLLLLHHVGARTGTKRVTPMMYRAVDDSYAVFPSNAGANSHSAWYHNLIAHPDDVVRNVAGTDRKGLVVVETSTFPLGAKLEAREMLRGAGIEMIDAPVSGTGLQAETAEIVVYASGDSAIIERLQPVFRALARETFDLGDFGNGSKMKFVANLLVSINNLAIAEAFVLGTRAGLEAQRILEVISAGVGTSRIFEIRGPMIIADDYPAAAKLKMFIKDISVIGDFGREIGVPTPLLDAALPLYEEAVDIGLGDLDAASLARLLRSKADSNAT